MKQDQDEYSKAFMADDAAEDMGDENMASESAAEATGDAPAAAVVIVEPADAPEPNSEEGPTDGEGNVNGEDAAMSPEDKQREKSWEGRLRAKEAELAAREAKLAEMANPKGDVQKLADGGEVEEEMPVPETKEEPAMPAEGEDMMAESPEEAPVDVEQPAEATAPADTNMVDAIRSDAIALAKDPAKLAGVLENMIADYGREFVVGMIAANAPMVEAMADPYISDVEGRIESVINGINQAWTDRHFEAIRDAHEDFEEIAESDEFKEWAASLPEEEQAKVQETIERGSAGRIVALLTKYKDSKKPKEQSPEDIWAEDAAAGVKSSAPVNLPTRAPQSEEDEYKAAFNSM